MCPVCGARVELVGTTTDGRLIGSCDDAFWPAAWEGADDEEGQEEAQDAVRRLARARVLADYDLRPFEGVLLDSDWVEGDEHWAWVADAPKEEVLNWAVVTQREINLANEEEDEG